MMNDEQVPCAPGFGGAWYAGGQRGPDYGIWPKVFPSSSLLLSSLELSDAHVHEPEIQALLETASHFLQGLPPRP